MAKDILVTAKRIKGRKKLMRLAVVTFCSLFIVLTVVFIILAFLFNGGKFTISLDNNDDLVTSLALFDNLEDREIKRKLYADEVDFMDNISVKWLPEDIDSGKHEGSHNGDNYIAYTFYLGNTGNQPVNYWYEVVIDDVIKNVDEAVRIMIFRNGEKTIYAKLNRDTGKEEAGTTAFYENEKSSEEHIAVLEEVKNFKPLAIDKFTIVVWLEGDDPDCVNAIIGGEIKMHMNIREEHILPNDYKLEKKESED
jgi:hypothetical protein